MKSFVLLVAGILGSMSCAEQSRYATTSPVAETVFATVSDQFRSERFPVRGGISIHQAEDGTRHVDVSFSGGGLRFDGDTQCSALLGDLTDPGAFLAGQSLDHPSLQAQISYAASNGTHAFRPITSAVLTREPDRTFTMRLTLGDVLHRGPAEDSLDEAATALIEGELRVGCDTLGPVAATSTNPDGTVIEAHTRIGDPTFSTPFCREALTALGLEEFAAAR